MLLPPHLIGARRTYLSACQQELGVAIRPLHADELRWWFRARRAQGEARALAAEVVQRCAKAARTFARPRYQALYRSWCMLGDQVIDSAMSPVLADAIERGTGRIECEVLARPYMHLSTLVGTA